MKVAAPQVVSELNTTKEVTVTMIRGDNLTVSMQNPTGESIRIAFAYDFALNKWVVTVPNVRHDLLVQTSGEKELK